VCCSAWLCVAVCCCVLQCVAVYCNVLLCISRLMNSYLSGLTYSHKKKILKSQPTRYRIASKLNFENFYLCGLIGQVSQKSFRRYFGKCVAVYCNALHFVAVCRVYLANNLLFFSSVYILKIPLSSSLSQFESCSVLQCVAVCCSAWQCVTEC